MCSFSCLSLPPCLGVILCHRVPKQFWFVPNILGLLDKAIFKILNLPTPWFLRLKWELGKLDQVKCPCHCFTRHHSAGFFLSCHTRTTLVKQKKSLPEEKKKGHLLKDVHVWMDPREVWLQEERNQDNTRARLHPALLATLPLSVLLAFSRPASSVYSSCIQSRITATCQGLRELLN